MSEPEPIEKIENIRDLLAVVLAPELGKWFADQPTTPPLTLDNTVAHTQAMIAVVLDMMTAQSCRLLAEFKEAGGRPRDPRVGDEAVVLPLRYDA